MIPLAVPYIGDDERAAVDRVLRSGQLSQGPEVAAFEAEFAELVGGRHCIAVNSGTSALHLSMLAAGIGSGDEVIVPSFTFAASANSIALTGATPVFVDIEPDHFTIDVESARAAIGPRTAAIMAVDLYGHPARHDALTALAEQHGLALFEDAAQAHGARLGDTACGAWGTAASFSFYPTKNMTTGEGGIITTGDADVARRCRLLRNQGMEERYRNEVVGLNVRMTDMAAAIGRVQLGRLGEWTEARRRNAHRYDTTLTSVAVPPVADDAHHVYHQYTVRSADRDDLVQRLLDAGVGAGVYYPVPVHRLDSFDIDLDLPETERAAREVCSIPVHPFLSDGDLERIVSEVNA